MLGKKSSTTVIFKSLNVNVIEDASGVFIGDNTQWNFSSHLKQNYGFGAVHGEKNSVNNPYNIVYDPDEVDHPVNQCEQREIYQGNSR